MGERERCLSYNYRNFFPFAQKPTKNLEKRKFLRYWFEICEEIKTERI